jgi:hypothetical protein
LKVKYACNRQYKNYKQKENINQKNEYMEEWNILGEHNWYADPR